MVFCVSQSGSLFAADAWHDITFAAEEVKDPRRTLPRSLAIGTVIVMLLYLAANVAYLAVLGFPEIQHAPHDRVATAMLQQIFPAWGGAALAALIMVSTFGCINSLVLAGPRAYYAMARDRLFFPAAGRLNRASVPGWSLAMQGVWAALLVLLTTYSPATGYGNLYSDLLDYIISAALLFYVLTISAVVVLRHKRPDAERPYDLCSWRQRCRALPFHRPAGDYLARAGAGHRRTSCVLGSPACRCAQHFLVQFFWAEKATCTTFHRSKLTVEWNRRSLHYATSDFLSGLPALANFMRLSERKQVLD